MSDQAQEMLAGTEEDPAESLLDAFIATGDLDGLVDDESEAQAAQGAEADPTDDETDDEDDTEVEAKASDDDADEDEGEFIEFETEDGEKSRVSVEEALQAYNQLKELGPDVSQIRHQAFEQASQQVTQRVQQLDQHILQAAETFALINELVPNLEEPSDAYIDPNSEHFNPAYYRQQKEAIANVREMVDGAKGKLKELQEARQKEAATQREMDANKHWAMLLDADPSWKNLSGDQAVKRLNDLRGGVQQTYGLPAEVVNGIYDNGFIRMAQDALAYRKAASKPLEAKPKQPARLVKTGSKRKAADSQATNRKRAANKQLRQTGKVTDLEGVWGEFLD